MIGTFQKGRKENNRILVLEEESMNNKVLVLEYNNRRKRAGN